MDFIYGTITSAPTGFAPPEAWLEYAHITEPVAVCKREHIAGHSAAIRWCLWPICFEEYIGSAEPDTRRAAAGKLCYNRIAIWKRISPCTIPRGWYALSKKVSRVDGTKLFENGNVTEGWHKNAKRDLKLWQEHAGRTHRIEEISLEEYTAAYKKSLIAVREGEWRVEDVAHKISVPLTRANTTLYGVRNLESGAIIAGSAVINSPTYKSSAHFAPFICEEARDVYAATGLMHHWFLESLRQGSPRVVTTSFWYKGNPKSWKGFSEFKSHFGFEYVAYPPDLYRFVPGKLF